MNEYLQARAALGVVMRRHPDDAEAVRAARERFEAARLERYVRQALSGGLSNEDRERLAALLLAAA